MTFLTDKQTSEDLNLLNKYRGNSVYTLFNKVKTDGGKRLLDDMFDFPLNDEHTINMRSSIFKIFSNVVKDFPVIEYEFELIEDYLRSAVGKHRLDFFKIRAMAFVGLDKDYQIIQHGFYLTVNFLVKLYNYLKSLPLHDLPEEFVKVIEAVVAILNETRLNWLTKVIEQKAVSQLKMSAYDTVLRFTMRREMKEILQLVYQMDVYVEVSKVAKMRGFVYAKALGESDHLIEVKGLYHPEIKRAVANDIQLNKDSNVLFLTGANMAGKSTIMKAFGIAFYLAHMGFPIAAHDMVFSVKDGLYTSINVPDDLNTGYSHFYAEVLRVKKVAEQVSQGKNILVIFDELFKGTNVKDAYDATLAVIKAFSKYQNCAFIVSTHIIEVGKDLEKDCKNLKFSYLPTIMDGVKPTYTYKLTEGITEDRHGMMILNNEKILEIIKLKS